MEIDFSDAMRAVQGMANAFVMRVPHLLVGVVVFLLFYVAARVVRGSVHAVLRRKESRRNVAEVVGRLGFGIIWLLGLLVALVIAVPGFTPGQLVNVLGLSSVAIGFAFRDILQNFLAGILLLLSQPFRVGDQIVAGNFEGTVEDIQTRATFLMTYDGRRVVIPNATLFTNSVIVNTAHPIRRLEHDLTVDYGDVGKAKRVIAAELDRQPEALKQPAPEVLVVRVADSGITLRMRWWVRPPHQFDVLHSQDVVLNQVVDALLDEGVDLPYPTHEVMLHYMDKKEGA